MTLTLFRWIVLLVVQVACYALPDGKRNAYQILGLSRDCTGEDIRHQYRHLCLKYHPDKNCHLSAVGRSRREDAFKLVQRAYADVGDEAKRREYDFALASSPLQRNRSYGNDSAVRGTYAGDYASETLHRALYEQYRRYGTPAGAPDGVPLHAFNNRSARASSGGIRFAVHTPFGSFFPGEGHLGSNSRSVFTQEIYVPLNILYSGSEADGKSFKLTLSERPWKKYCAAFRGGIARRIAAQCFISSVPFLLRTKLYTTSVFFLALFHYSLPRPQRTTYEARIKKGWKSGTRLMYKDVEPGISVVFILREEKHDRFKRCGDDLHTQVAVSRRVAKLGGNVVLPPLDSSETPVFVKIVAGKLLLTGKSRNGRESHTVVVHGRGWPKKDGGHGNLIVDLHLSPVRIHTPKLGFRRRKRKERKGALK